MRHQLRDLLDSVTCIPIIPFRGGRIDFAAHQKNVLYLMRQNVLSEGRPRVICVAGTSLINHVSLADRNALVASSGEVMNGQGVLMSALLPNLLTDMMSQVEIQSRMARPPEVYLIMPIEGVYSPEGMYQELGRFCNDCHRRYGANFLYYHRMPRDHDAVVRLVRDCEGMVGIKVGTSVDEVPALVRSIGDAGMVIWGIGDRSTAAARLGTRGHTSGISVLFAKAGDMINNAQRAGDYETSQTIESRISALEDLRFRQARAYNYAAVQTAMEIVGFSDIDAGEGGPYNPPLPDEVRREVALAIAGLEDLH